MDIIDMGSKKTLQKDALEAVERRDPCGLKELDNIYLCIEGSRCLSRFSMYSCKIALEEAVFRDIFVYSSIVSAIQPPLSFLDSEGVQTFPTSSPSYIGNSKWTQAPKPGM
jgi:hypothetical protein